MGYEEDPTASRAYIFEVPDKERPLRVMIDTVPYTPELADEVAKAMGPHGINILFFTSARRLVDGEKWALRFPIMQCVIHALDTQDDAKARFIPLKLKGKGPWENFGGGITVVSTPGMTPGHISIFLRHFRYANDGHCSSFFALWLYLYGIVTGRVPPVCSGQWQSSLVLW